MVFVALTNCFRKEKVLCTSLILLSFVIFFVVQKLIVPSQTSSYFLGGTIKSIQFFQLSSSVSFDFKYYCFRKVSVNF